MSKANATLDPTPVDPVPLDRVPRERIRPWQTRIFVRDLVLSCKLGIHQHERLARQRIRINLELDFRPDRPIEDDLENVVCYSELVTGVRHVVGAGHVNLAETLAERIAAMCLDDARVHGVRVRIEKLDVFPEAESVGVEIERRRASD